MDIKSTLKTLIKTFIAFSLLTISTASMSCEIDNTTTEASSDNEQGETSEYNIDLSAIMAMDNSEEEDMPKFIQNIVENTTEDTKSEDTEDDSNNATS